MGHSSIAEHGIFNIDMIGISRLLSEELEKSRLVSFTEKSQRYIKIGEDILLPEEIKKDKLLIGKYENLIKELFDSYNILHEDLVPYFTEKYPVENQKSSKFRDVVNLAKEDARYILPLSTLTQVGMTINSRNLEKIIRKLAAFSLAESNELAKKIYESVKDYAPSLVKYTMPTDYETKTYSSIKELINNIFESKDLLTKNSNEVELINFDKDCENKIIAGFITKSSSIDYNSALKLSEKLNKNDKLKIFKKSLEFINSYDGLEREYEISDFEFNILITATAFAQIKRHRMVSLIDGEYSPDLGVKIPQSIIDVGKKDFFMEKIDLIDKFFFETKNKYGIASNYILSNAHRKNILLKCNFRELVHITRLRSDIHAQWDIREISEKISAQVNQKFPYLGILLCGKDKFEENMTKFKNQI
jgi:thymidylate synthase ThyX